MDKIQAQLITSSILKVPLQTYDDFTFIVNGESFKTHRIIADLLSSKVCQIHAADPTCKEIFITTKNRGNFIYFLNLSNFNQSDIPEDEIPFITELIEILGNDSINFNIPVEITINNALSLIKKHEKKTSFYFNIIEREIEFISSHFFEICKKDKYEEFMKINPSTLEQIIRHQKFQLKNEDQLLSLINFLYSNEIKYSILYEYVYFQNCQQATILDFLKIYNINDINTATWQALSKRLSEKVDIENNQIDSKNDRYVENQSLFFPYETNKEFRGIINYLLEKTNGDVDKAVNITSLTVGGDHSPKNVALFGNNSKYYYSLNESNQWICFDFKNYKIIPTNYTIQSVKSSCNLKSWFIEGSNDNSNWEIIDEISNCNDLKEHFKIQNFQISKPMSKAFRYVRIRQISNCNNNFIMTVTSFEFFGKLIQN